MNTHVRDNLNALVAYRAVKGSDETVNNSNTFQSDNDLLFAIGANEVWEFDFYVIFSSGTTPDIKFQITVPSGAVGGSSLRPIATGDFQEFGTSLGTVAGTGADARAWMHGFVINGATPGSVTLQWAQATTNLSDTIVRAGSRLNAHKLIAP